MRFVKVFNFRSSYLLLALILFTALLSLNSVSFASDHIDGAATIEDGQADLTDLYAFKSPESPDTLSLVLNMYPGVGPSGHFSNKVSYKLTIRNAQKNTAPLQLGFKTLVSDELSFDCKFLDPGHHSHGANNSRGEVSCSLKKEQAVIEEISGNVGDILSAKTFKLFTGPRSDAFFISAEAFLKTTSRKGYVTTDRETALNSMNTINVMSIAVDLDLKALGLSNTLLAIAGQSYTLRGGVFESLDRVGRPEITNLSLHDHSGSSPLKREFNKTEIFQPYQTLDTKFESRLRENIKAYDRLDERLQWENPEDLDALTKILVDDFLVVDTSTNCDRENTSFFSLELSMLQGLTTSKCGGRDFEDDIMTKLYALYIGGLSETRYSLYETGVSAPYQNNPAKELSSSFPYLPSMSETSTKQWFLFNAAKLIQE